MLNFSLNGSKFRGLTCFPMFVQNPNFNFFTSKEVQFAKKIFKQLKSKCSIFVILFSAVSECLHNG